MTVDLDVPAGTETEIAAAVARLDDVVYAGLGPTERERYDAIARLFLDLIADDGYHWGCTSAEAAEEDADAAYDSGFEGGFAAAQERIVDGLTRLQEASMVEAETVVEIVPRIQRMTPWDDAAPGNRPRETKTPPEQV